MKSTKLSLAIASVCLVASSGVLAQYLEAPAMTSKDSASIPRGTFKSKDSQGRTVYSDREVGLKVQSKIPEPASTSSTVPATKTEKSKAKADASQGVSLEEYAKRTQKELDDSKKAVDDTNKLVRERNCTQAKNALASLESGRRIARSDEKGDRVFLDSKEISADTERAQKQVADNC